MPGTLVLSHYHLGALVQPFILSRPWFSLSLSERVRLDDL